LGIGLQGEGKKLIQVARYWAGERATSRATVSEDIVTQLINLGAPDDVIAAARDKCQALDEDCLVWEENWQAVLFFLEISHQWLIVSGMGGLHYIGLNYPAIESVIRTFAPVPRSARAALWSDLRVLERAALEVLNLPKE
jgi:hypothetical protein